MNTLYLATGKWFYTHGFQTMFIIALLFTLIGVLFGYYIWRHYKGQIKRVEDTNVKLRDKRHLLEEHLKKLETILKENS